MNKRQVVVLWIVAIVLAAAAFAARSGKSKGFENKTERSRGQTVLADFPADQVARIRVSSGTEVTTLVRKDGKWSVEERDGYPADASIVNDFLRTLAEVKVTESVEAEPSFAPRFGMNPDASDEAERGTEVVMSNDAGTELARVTLGKNLQAAGDDPMTMMMMGGGGMTGRFIRNHSDETGVYKVSEMFSSLSPEPRRWLESGFLKIDKIKSISVSPKAQPDKVDWKVSRDEEAADFTLEGAKEGEALDTAATTPLKSLFSYARFEDVVPDDKVGEIARPLEKRTVKIETLEGFVYDITVTAVEPEEPGDEEPSGDPEAYYLMTVGVEATIAAERKQEDGESEEDAKTKDQAFTTRKAELEKRLADEKALAGRTFKVTSYTVDALLKDRASIVQGENAAALPAGSATTPPVQVPPSGGRIEAVTPPIAIPPLEESGGQEE